MDARRFDESGAAQCKKLVVGNQLSVVSERAESKAIVVLTTVAETKEAEDLARKIVEAKLAACVQILPPMKSVYFWEDEVQTDSEQLLLIKTLGGKFDELKAFIQTNHSYETPEIIALEASAVAETYLDWMVNNLEK